MQRLFLAVLSSTFVVLVIFLVYHVSSAKFSILFVLQQFGPILDVEIIFNERGSKVMRFVPFVLRPLAPRIVRANAINEINERAPSANCRSFSQRAAHDVSSL